MHTSHELKCVHGNAARYCDVCEIMQLREERLKLFDEVSAADGRARAGIWFGVVALGLAIVWILIR